MIPKKENKKIDEQTLKDWADLLGEGKVWNFRIVNILTADARVSAVHI
jgi:hypothetical protein